MLKGPRKGHLYFCGFSTSTEGQVHTTFHNHKELRTLIPEQKGKAKQITLTLSNHTQIRAACPRTNQDFAG